jgi:hypothetical protein
MNLLSAPQHQKNILLLLSLFSYISFFFNFTRTPHTHASSADLASFTVHYLYITVSFIFTIFTSLSRSSCQRSMLDEYSLLRLFSVHASFLFLCNSCVCNPCTCTNWKVPYVMDIIYCIASIWTVCGFGLIWILDSCQRVESLSSRSISVNE